MTYSRMYMISVALIVAIGGFLLGFDATVISGTVPFIQKYFDLTGVSGDLKLWWSAFLSCGLLILATLPFVVFVHRNQQQTVVILESRPGPQKRLPLAGTKT